MKLLKIALQKRGLLESDQKLQAGLETKTCPFCTATVGFNEILCPKCKHLLDRKNILNEKEKDEEIQRLKNSVMDMDARFENLTQEFMQDFAQKILNTKSAQELFKS